METFLPPPPEREAPEPISPPSPISDEEFLLLSRLPSPPLVTPSPAPSPSTSTSTTATSKERGSRRKAVHLAPAQLLETFESEQQMQRQQPQQSQQSQQSQPQSQSHSPSVDAPPSSIIPAPLPPPAGSTGVILQSPKRENLAKLEGYLMKWTNLVKGWKRRYFVLASGALMYFLDHHLRSCRGSVILCNATLAVDTRDDCAFIITTPDVKTLWLRADSSYERERWVSAIGNTRSAVAGLVLEEAHSPRKQTTDPIVELQEIISTANLDRSELENALQSLKVLVNGNKKLGALEAGEFLKRAEVLISTTDSIVCSVSPIVEFVAAVQQKNQLLEAERVRLQTEIDRLSKAPANESEERTRNLLWSLSQLALRKGIEEYADASESESDDDDDYEYFDAEDFLPDEMDGSMKEVQTPKATEVQIAQETLTKSSYPAQPALLPLTKSSTHLEVPFSRSLEYASSRRRARLPANKSNEKISIWAIVKESIGKDITKITLPVILCEPLSFIQRCAEDFEYSELLDIASDQTDAATRLLYVASFAISGYSSTERTGKPFNPLLGETYELVSPHRKFCYLAEQVSHHPPITAIHCESENYVYWTDVEVKNKFWGRSIEVFPTGKLCLRLPRTDDFYTWTKITTCVHNIMIGTLWIENYGTMEIVDHKRHLSCKIDFQKKGWGDSGGKVEAKIAEASGKLRYSLAGRWNESLVATNHNTGEKFEIWRRSSLPTSHKEQYEMTSFAIELNDLDPAVAAILPRTDSRFRPDKRALEEGDLELAGKEKNRLEEKQRAARKAMEARTLQWTPRWFNRAEDGSWVYRGGYWRSRADKAFESQDIPDIY